VNAFHHFKGFLFIFPRFYFSEVSKNLQYTKIYVILHTLTDDECFERFSPFFHVFNVFETF